jgi:hypothetical protein
MKANDTVKFNNPMDADEQNALMIVREMRGDRVLVSDARFNGEAIAPTFVYPAADLVAA